MSWYNLVCEKRAWASKIIVEACADDAGFGSMKGLIAGLRSVEAIGIDPKSGGSTAHLGSHLDMKDLTPIADLGPSSVQIVF